MILSSTSFNLLSFSTALLYLASAVIIGFDVLYRQQLIRHRKTCLLLGCLAVTGHLILAAQNVNASGIISHDFFNMLSLVFLVISCLFLISVLSKPIDTLAIIITPFAATTVLLNLGMPTSEHPSSTINPDIQTHIVLSILSYSLLTVAAFQAIMLSLQERQLHARHPGHFINALPPLQVMEKLLFQTLGFGVALLSFSLLSGFLFLDNIFAQHLAHKTLLSILAWLVFSILLWARFYLGWRGQQAVKWVYSGYFLLMLAYFGSKFVLQLLLSQP